MHLASTDLRTVLCSSLSLPLTKSLRVTGSDNDFDSKLIFHREHTLWKGEVG